MPFLRVIRDKRGYETTYLMDWYRDGSRQRSRILYVFRTPGGVRVGRTPLEPEVLQQIQSTYPTIAFDWKAVLETRQVIDAAPDPRRPQQRRRPSGDAPPVLATSTSPGGQSLPVSSDAALPRPPFPSSIDGSSADERVAFLAQWYPVARERIAHRMTDPVRREALMALAERLNPVAWTDADQVASGLERASEALERLSRVLTRRRRRSGRARAVALDAIPRAAETDQLEGAETPDAQVPDPEAPDPQVSSDSSASNE